MLLPKVPKVLWCLGRPFVAVPRLSRPRLQFLSRAKGRGSDMSVINQAMVLRPMFAIGQLGVCYADV